LRDAIAEALSDDARRGVMSARCRAVAVTEYSLDVQARAYAKLYETLLSRARAGRAGAISDGGPVVASEPILPRVSPSR
jgi:hypothetical protein